MSEHITAQHHMDVGRMSPRQWIAVAVAILVNALDGYDNAAISFAAPSIAADWGLSSDRLGWLLSMELLGMAAGRSEEHTSELQSLMRITYAVFCLKKKNNTRNRDRKKRH